HKFKVKINFLFIMILLLFLSGYFIFLFAKSLVYRFNKRQKYVYFLVENDNLLLNEQTKKPA
uniref:hypothetical protein n=1 Tax=Yersinia aleksiciae TaxID=263819 RepID=UPI001C95A000